MTMNEIEQVIKSSLQRQDGKHPVVYIRFEPVEVDTQFLLDAWSQIKSIVLLCEAGVLHPVNHRAEALALMLFDKASFHGYTPDTSRRRQG